MSTSGNIVMDSPLGRILIAEEDGYISKILFLNKEDDIYPDSPTRLTDMAVRDLEAYFSGKNIAFNFPFRQRGTDFQHKVWNALLAIPAGKTISYLELARRLGDEKVIRAAASANGKNNLAIVVPCHRVIGSNYSLVGYAGGIWRKKWLLDHERSLTGNYRQYELF